MPPSIGQVAERAEAPAQSLATLRQPRSGAAERGRAALELQRVVGNAQVGRLFPLLQRKEAVAPISDRQTASAIAWGIEAKLGEETIRELQKTLSISLSGVYDQPTVLGVYQKQGEWKKKGKIANPGKATADVFARLGLILTRTIAPAHINDEQL